MKQIRYILLFTALATMMLLAAACGGGGGNSGVTPSPKPDGPVTPTTPASVTFKQASVEAAKGSQFIVITASGAWTLTSSQSWLKVSQSSGNGNTSTVSVSYEANTANDARTATLTLTCGGSTATATLTQKGAGPATTTVTSPGWLELPELKLVSGHKFVYHQFASAGKTGRSFSFDWSPSDLVAMWVAYPLNNSLKGSGNRSDAWAYDPDVLTADQPTLFSAYKGTGSYSYDRGHQLPSADRLSYQDNVMTFYFTNMTPQLNAFNGGIWANAENLVRNWASKCDTLYVVTGCVVKGSSQKAYDNNNKAVTVPVAYWKAVLRYSNGSTLGYSGYMGLAMYFEHKGYSQNSITSSSTGIVMSIDALEAKIGIDLFPNLAKKMGQTVSDQVEAEDPTKNSYWW